MTASLPQPQPARRLKGPRTVMALILREMETTYGRSPGGYIWAVLEPIGAITMFTLVIAYGLKLKSPGIGNNFMLFYATGYLPYMLFMQTNAKVYRAVKFSRQLLQYPRVTFVDAIMGRFLLNLMTHMVVFYLLMTGIHYIWDIDLSLDVGAIMTSLAMAAVLGLGFGCMNCFLMWFFPVWESFWIVLTRPLLLMSTVIYTFEDVPWQHQDKLWWNPLIHIIGLMRRGFYPSYEAEYVSVLYVFGLGLVLLAMGMVLLYRWNRILLRRV